MERTHIWQRQEADLQRLEEAMHSPRLIEDCKWFKPGIGFSCKASDIGLDYYVECLEKQSHMCPFSLSYAYSYYCSCRARVFIAKQLKNYPIKSQ
jgi:hypothetical protein